MFLRLSKNQLQTTLLTAFISAELMNTIFTTSLEGSMNCHIPAYKIVIWSTEERADRQAKRDIKWPVFTFEIYRTAALTYFTLLTHPYTGQFNRILSFIQMACWGKYINVTLPLILLKVLCTCICAFYLVVHSTHCDYSNADGCVVFLWPPNDI